MSTQMVYLTGIAKWAKVYKPDDKYQNFSLDLYLDKPSWAVFEESGLGLTPKEDDDGKFIKLRRPVSKVIKGELVKFGPPAVFDKDKKEITDLIGNGSRVTVKVAVFDTVKGKGHRMEAVRVDELVKYAGNSDPGFPEIPAGTMGKSPAAGRGGELPPF